MLKPLESSIFFKDLGKVSSRRTTKEGFLSVVADFARIGIQEYHVGELPMDQVPHDLRDDPYAIVRLLRPEKEVFADASMQSFSQKPVTDNHPSVNVTANNFKDLQVGFSGTDVTKNQDRLRVPLLIQDKDVIAKIKDGKDQLSAGYSAKVIWSSGVHDSFGPYDAIQSDIAGNHIAIVDKARGGENVRINDSWSDVEERTKNKKGKTEMLKRKIKGISFEFSDQSAEAVDGLISTVGDQKTEIQTLKATLQDEKKAKEKLQGEFDAHKKTQLTDADIEAKVSERLAIVDRARALKPDLDPTGKKIADIQVEAIEAVDPEFDLADKKPHYIEAAFDTFYAKREKKGKASAKKAGENAGTGNADEVSIADAARDAYVENGKYAWMDTLGMDRPKKVEVQ